LHGLDQCSQFERITVQHDIGLQQHWLDDAGRTLEDGV